MSRSNKIESVLEEIQEKLEKGNYRYAKHAAERLQQRYVTRLEVKQVLKRGYHENVRTNLAKKKTFGIILFVEKQ